MGGRYRAVENMRRIGMKACPVPLFATMPLKICKLGDSFHIIYGPIQNDAA